VDVSDAGDGPVAINGNGNQVEDGRGAADDVERHPDVAEHLAEKPTFTYLDIEQRR